MVNLDCLALSCVSYDVIFATCASVQSLLAPSQDLKSMTFWADLLDRILECEYVMSCEISRDQDTLDNLMC